MIVVGVLVVSLLLFRAAGALGVTALASWVASTRWALAVMFLFVRVLHFTRRGRDGMARMVPNAFGNAMSIIYFAGVCEIAGAIGMLIPRTRVLAGVGLILFLIAVFPANVKGAREKLTVGRRQVTPLGPAHGDADPLHCADLVVHPRRVGDKNRGAFTAGRSTRSGKRRERRTSRAPTRLLSSGYAAVRESRAITCDHPERQWDSGGTRHSGFRQELV
jgi:uncharacterized membrane protein